MFAKKQLLDPVGTMCRLITLNFRPKDTKISVNNHTIIIQSPSSLQWMQRKFNGDDRDNISSLFPVVMRIIEWYIVPLYDVKFKNKKTKINNNLKVDIILPKNKKGIEDEKLEEPINDNTYLSLEEKEVDPYWDCIHKLCKYMNMGLSKLQETYENGNVVYTIQFYINLIIDALDGKYTRDKIPKCISNNDNKNLFDYNKIKGLWDYKRVKEICELYDKCFDASNDQKETEENKKEKIEGYLLAIEHLLNISDDAFRNLIESNQNE